MASPEITLQGTIKAAVAALTYITANSVPVRNWDDSDDARALPCVLVRVLPRERIAPNAPYYKMPVEISCLRHRGDDPNGTGQDSIYAEISTWANGSGIATTLSADGVVQMPGNDELIDSIQFRTVMFDVYDTIA